jgi:hypothetical protein
MDEGLSRAVREAFVRLYEKKLIFRDLYLINWCPAVSYGAFGHRGRASGDEWQFVAH